jgi:hypothetical protein
MWCELLVESAAGGCSFWGTVASGQPIAEKWKGLLCNTLMADAGL